MSRINRILAILMVAQLGIVWAVHRNDGVSDETVPVYADIDEVGAITSLEVSDGKNSVRLSRVDDAWVLPEAGNVPTPEGRVDSLLERLVELRLERPIATQETSHARLNVGAEAFTRKLTLNGDRIIYLGRGSGFGAMHLRKEGSSEVHRIEEFVEYDWTPRNSAWVETTIIDKRSGDLRSFTLENEHGVHVFHKDSDDKWTMTGPAPAGKEFDDTQFGIWLNQQGSWLLADVVGLNPQPEYGLESPRAKLTFVIETKTQVEDESAEPGEDGKRPMIDRFEHETKVLTIGAVRGSVGDHYAAFTGDQRIFTIPAHRIEDVSRTRDSFFKDAAPAGE